MTIYYEMLNKEDYMSDFLVCNVDLSAEQEDITLNLKGNKSKITSSVI